MAEAAALLPNIRRLFIPDPGYVIVDADLKGADAQVVAWEAGDEDLKAAFRAGLNVHHKNGCDMDPEFAKLDPNSGAYKRQYKKLKSGVHGTNYVGSARTLAITLGWSISYAEQFQRKWFALHPRIRTHFHDTIRDSLERTRRVTNKFGFHRVYFDRIDTVLPEAVAWLPQSTVALTCFRGALQVREHLPWVQMLLQVHDSLVFQIPKARVRDLLLVRDRLLNPVPYDDPLIIPWEMSISDKSWGDVKGVSWEEAIDLKF